MKGVYPSPSCIPSIYTDLITPALILVGGFGTRLRPLVGDSLFFSSIDFILLFYRAIANLSVLDSYPS